MNLIEFKNMMTKLKSYVKYVEECDHEITYQAYDVKIKYQFNTHEISLVYEIEEVKPFTNGNLVVNRSCEFLFKSNDLTGDDIMRGVLSM